GRGPRTVGPTASGRGHKGQLLRAGGPRRILGQPSTGPPLRLPQLERLQLPFWPPHLRPGVPAGQNISSLIVTSWVPGRSGRENRRITARTRGEVAMQLGFIGLGYMGAGMAANLQKAGYKLVVHDIRQDSATPHLKAGASPRSRPWRSVPAG